MRKEISNCNQGKYGNLQPVNLVLLFAVFVITGLFFGPITGWYRQTLTFFFDPSLRNILDWHQTYLGFLILIITALAIIAYWYELRKREFTFRGRNPIGMLATIVSFHYILIRFFPLINTEVYQLPWTYLPIGNFVVKFSDVVAIPFTLELLAFLCKKTKYFPTVVDYFKAKILTILHKNTSRQSNKPEQYSIKNTDWLEDTPAKKKDDDIFYRKELVMQIVNRMLEWKPKESSFNIAITGEWGSGKTSFLNMVKHELEGKAIVVDYIPWSYHNSTDITSEFFNQLAQELEKETSENYIELAKIIRNTVIGNGFPWSLIASIMDYPRSYSDLKNRIETAIKDKTDLPLVIVVDELDRIEADELPEVFKLLKNLASIKGSYIITSFDKKAVTNNLKNITDGNKYLEKFFQVEIPLGKVSLSQTVTTELTRWMESIGIEQNHTQAIRTTIGTFDGLERELTNNYSIWAVINNHRRLIIFKNTINTRLPFFSTKLDAYSYILFELIRLYYPVIYQWLESREIVAYPNEGFYYGFHRHRFDELKSPKGELQALPTYEKLFILEALEEIFMKKPEARLQFLPNNIYYYDLYFTNHYYKSLDLISLAEYRANKNYNGFLDVLNSANKVELPLIQDYMSKYDVVTVEDLLFEFECALSFDNLYDGHSDRVIGWLKSFENKENNDIKSELKKSVIAKCKSLINEKMSYPLFVSWRKHIDRDKSQRIFSLNEINELCRARYQSAVEKKLSMDALHKYLRSCQDEWTFTEDDHYDPSVMNDFIMLISNDEEIGHQFLKYCIKPSQQKGDFYQSDHQLSFEWVFSVKFFISVDNLRDFLTSKSKSKNRELKKTAERVLRFEEKAGFNMFRRNYYNGGYPISLEESKQAGIDIQDMDPAVFKGINLSEADDNPV